MNDTYWEKSAHELVYLERVLALSQSIGLYEIIIFIYTGLWFK